MNEQYADLINKHGLQMGIIERLLKEVEVDTRHAQSMYLRYQAHEDGVPILKRTLFNVPLQEVYRRMSVTRVDDKVKNCINRNFEADIVDTKVGYFSGIPITRSVAGESNFEHIVTEWDKEQDIADKDSTTVKMSAITGVAYRLLYVDKTGKAHAVNLDHTKESIAVLSRTGPSQPEYAVRKYTAIAYVEGNITNVEYLEFYDDTNITIFKYVDGTWQLSEVRRHLFEGCPLFAVPNNDELQSDFAKVLPAIDAYNRTLSDASDEIESNRLAYLILRGMQLGDEHDGDLKDNVLYAFDDGDGAEYLTKDVNDTMIENHLNRLEKNIYKDAKSVDFSDEKFAGNASGVALKYKNQGLENKVSAFERKFESFLRYQYMLLNTYWSSHGAFGVKAEPDKYRELEFTFKRNIPEDLLEKAEIQQKLIGVVSDRERLKHFVGDVDKELEQIEAERDVLEDMEDTYTDAFE